jgi:hypothetical protein
VFSSGFVLDHGADALKLALVVDRRPCELRLLGRKVSKADVVLAATFFVLARVGAAVGINVTSLLLR